MRARLILACLVLAAAGLVAGTHAGAAGKAGSRPGTTFRDCRDCPEMVVIPAGSFTMGSPADEPGRRADESPQRTISFARSFAAGRYEITRAQYAAFSKATGRPAKNLCAFPTPNGNWRETGYPPSGYDHPVACVSWEDAQAYVAWLNKKTRGGYRLLSEAEWEYVARAGTTGRYHNGGAESQLCDMANWADSSSTMNWRSTVCNDGWAYTAPVGSLKPNAFGVYDMSGNAAEWVQDCYVANLESVPADGVALETPACERRGFRGGSFTAIPAYLRSASRGGMAPAKASSNQGFRIARTL